MGDDWAGYYTTVSSRAPRDTLVAALAAFDQDDAVRAAASRDPAPGSGGVAPQRVAVDLACGDGTDTVELLRRGWTVTAIDASPDFPRFLLPRVAGQDRGRLTVQVADFGSVALPPCDLLHAGFALFFCPPTGFDDLWAGVRAAVRPGGRIACHLLGPRDSWVVDGPGRYPVHTRAQVDALLAGLDVERLEETAEPGWSYAGEKFWHLWRILARVPG